MVYARCLRGPDHGWSPVAWHPRGERIYVFGSGILLSMVAATMARGVAGKESTSPTPSPPAHPVVHLPIVAATSVGLFLTGISRPLLHAEKWVFWETQYSLLGLIQHDQRGNDRALDWFCPPRTGSSLGAATAYSGSWDFPVVRSVRYYSPSGSVRMRKLYAGNVANENPA